MRPEGPGNLQAWARDAATPPRPGWRRARGARSPPATPPTTRSRRSSTGSPPRRAAGRCSGMRPRDGQLVRPLLGTTRAEVTAYCERARPRLARGQLQRRADLRPQPHPRRPAAGAANGRTRRPPPTSCAPRSCCATRPSCSTPSSPPSSTAPARAPAARSSWRACASCTRRCAASSCSGSPTPPPAGRCRAPRATPSRSPGCAAPGTAMLDLGGGVRAVVERGVLRAERDR